MYYSYNSSILSGVHNWTPDIIVDEFIYCAVYITVNILLVLQWCRLCLVFIISPKIKFSSTIIFFSLYMYLVGCATSLFSSCSVVKYLC